MNKQPGPALALTMGEPGGVGPEITVKAHRALQGMDAAFFLIADPGALADLGISFKEIDAPSQARQVFPSALPVMNVGVSARAVQGTADPANARAVIASIEAAVKFALAGDAAGVVTNPIQKSSLIASGFRFPGHTEFLEALTKNAPSQVCVDRGAVMMLAGPGLKTVPITIHQSVADAAKSLTTEMIVRKGKIVAHSLRRDFSIPSPRIAVSGLNPHAGESGAMGAEDEKIIAPAVKHLREAGIDAKGPLPADTMFHEEARSKYDAALCMLHDQALIPVKTLSFHEAVNVTLGLPIVRTSPDHGTALDIAGKGLARADSLIAAIRLATEMAIARNSGS